MLENLMYDTILWASFLKDGDQRERGWHSKIKLFHVTVKVECGGVGVGEGGRGAKTSVEVQILPQHEKLLLKDRRHG